jgi:hypothetical protein
MLYYENVVPVMAKRHQNWALARRNDFTFAGQSNSAPLAAGEFAAAAAEYAIVFTGTEGALTPAVVLGLAPDDNLYLDAQKQWQARYIPAFVRRYPFVFSRDEGGTRFTLCIDEHYEGWNQEGLGYKLFNDDGEGTDYLKRVMNFVQAYQRDFLRTQALCNKLEELGLLAPMSAKFQLPSGEKAQLTGFRAIDRDKLAALPGAALSEMAGNGELELIYLHLQSLQNLKRVLSTSPDGQGDGADDTFPGESAAAATDGPLH